MRRPDTTVAEVAARVEALLGVGVQSAVEVAGSVTNRNVAARLRDGRRVLVKVGQREQLRAEAWALQHVADLGIPAPAVVALDHDHDHDSEHGPAPLSVLGWLDGAPTDDPLVLAEVGRAVRRLHDAVLSGYGLLEIGADGEPRGAHPSWASFVEAELAAVDELVAAGLLHGGDRDRISAAVAALGLGSWAGRGVLLHGDLKRLHVLARKGRWVGLIDWGDPVVGDPRWDLARLSMMGKPSLLAFLWGYGWQLDGELHRVLTGYRVVWNVSALGHEHRAGGDWFDAYRDGLRADLDRLESGTDAATPGG